MQKLLMTFAIAAVLVVPLGSVPAQQPQGQSMPGMPATGQAVDATQLAACVQGQRDATMLIEAAEARLEAARQANEPAAMRSAVDDLQATLSRVRSRLTSCASLEGAAADPHAGHMMTSPAPPGTPVMAPGSPAPASRATKPPAAADPHAGHVMPPAPAAGAKPAAPAPPSTTKPAPAKPPAAADPHAGHVMTPTPPVDHSKMQMGKPPAAKPSSPAGAKPAAPAAPMDHSKMAMGAPADPAATATDPVCGLKVDPTTAPKATHQGETYYFCSDRHQQLFTKTPAKYLPKRK